MIKQLVANVPKLIAHVDGVKTIYVKDYGAGNLRIAANQEDLRNSTAANLAPGQVADGIPQNAAAGVVQYFWSGDLWMISDQNDTIMVQIPAAEFYIDRSQGQPTPPSEIIAELSEDANLSTYR